MAAPLSAPRRRASTRVARGGWRSTSRTAVSAGDRRRRFARRARSRSARSRGGRAPGRADAAQLRAGVGRSLRRSRRQRRHQRPHAPRVPPPVDHLRAGVLRTRGAVARHRRTPRSRRSSSGCAGAATKRSPALRPVGPQRGAAAAVLPAARRRCRAARDACGAVILLPRRRRGPRLRVRRARFLTRQQLARSARRDPRRVAAVLRPARVDGSADL